MPGPYESGYMSPFPQSAAPYFGSSAGPYSVGYGGPYAIMAPQGNGMAFDSQSRPVMQYQGGAMPTAPVIIGGQAPVPGVPVASPSTRVPHPKGTWLHFSPTSVPANTQLPDPLTTQSANIGYRGQLFVVPASISPVFDIASLNFGTDPNFGSQVRGAAEVFDSQSLCNHPGILGDVGPAVPIGVVPRNKSGADRTFQASLWGTELR